MFPKRTEDNYIRTYTGRKFWPLNPRVCDVDIEDIAHHLSIVNRWTGATSIPLSVARHSIWVAKLLHDEDPEIQMKGLLHDASEAYLSDIARPVKSLIPNYKKFEKNLLEKIYIAFGLSPDFPEIIHWADNAMLCNEGACFMRHFRSVETRIEEHADVALQDSITKDYNSTDEIQDENEFMETFEDLRAQLRL